MNTHLLALQLMAVQGVLGAFDTLYHHELTEALPQRPGARRELQIHAARAVIYGVLFMGLSSWRWHGAWALVLAFLFGVEIILTLWDFVIEDRSRLLPATERITHTVLAINGGAFIMLLLLNLPGWWAQPTALAYQPQGWLSAFLALCGVGVGVSGIRDALAARRLAQREEHGADKAKLHFSDIPRHVLVTGGTGFIGQLLVAALLADRHQVTLLTRQPRQAAWLFQGRVRCIVGMNELPPQEKIDVIINLAGARILGWRWNAARKAVLLKSRVELTERIVAWIAAAHHKPSLMLSGSAIGYYGIQPQSDERQLDEDCPPQDIFMSQLCARWEQAASRATSHGVRVLRLRFGLVLGRGGALPSLLLPIRLGLGGRLGSGKQALSWIHVSDILGAMAHLWQRHEANHPGLPQDGVFNLVAPQAVSQQEFNLIAARLYHRPCLLPTPGQPIRRLLGEQADMLLEGQRVSCARLQASGFRFAYPELELALRNLA